MRHKIDPTPMSIGKPYKKMPCVARRARMPIKTALAEIVVVLVVTAAAMAVVAAVLAAAILAAALGANQFLKQISI